MASQVTAYRSANEPKSDCESSSNDSSDGELPSSDTDNDEVFSVNKRRKVGVSSKIQLPEPVSPVKPTKRNLNMWTQVLHNQNSDEIVKNLVNSTVTGKAMKSRGPEFYSRPRFDRHHKVSENESSPAPIHKTVETIVKGKIENFTIGQTPTTEEATEEPNPASNTNKRKNKRQNKRGGKKFKQQPQERKRIQRFRGNQTNVPIYPIGLQVILKKKRDLTPDLSVEEIAFEIAYRLWEQKRHLVIKMVEFMGNEKAISLCLRTEAIESNGGMETHKGNRRRTPGGVFIRLAQMDTEVEQEGFALILDADNPMSPNKMIANLKRKRNRENNNNNKTQVVHVPTTSSPSSVGSSGGGDVITTTDDSGVPSSSSSSNSISTSISDDVTDEQPATMEVDNHVKNGDDVTATSSTNILAPATTVEAPAAVAPPTVDAAPPLVVAGVSSLVETLAADQY